MRIADLRTPFVLIEMTRVRANIRAMADRAGAAGVQLRPHAKTHKSAVIAKMQIEAGAVGVCCAKLGEAEVLADAGISDIRVPYPVNPANADRVLALLPRTKLSIIVDDMDVAKGWSDAMTKAGATLDVLVKVDVGFHRCGINPSAVDAPERVAFVASLPGLNFRGLLSHAGQAYHAATLDTCAMFIEATVVAKQSDRVILDSGAKTLALDGARGFGSFPGHGLVIHMDGTPDETLLIERLSEEHATVKALAPTRLKIGDRVRVLPNHACVVTNLMDELVMAENGDATGAIKVDARGRIR